MRPGWQTKMMAGTAVLVLSATACDNDTSGPAAPAGTENAIVVNSTELSITVFPVDSPSSARTIGLAPTGSPVSIAARQNLVVVPMGFLATAVVVDLRTDDVSTVPLPDNSGATGVAFLDDSIVYVANPNLNTVSRINVSSGTHENEIEVGTFPQVVLAHDDHIWVMNAELDMSYRPARPGAISVIDPANDSVVTDILLTGFNPSAAQVYNGLIYVVNSGTFGQGDGSLSVVNPSTLQEIEHHSGFGEFPGDMAIGPDALAYVSSFDYGLAVWDLVGDTFISPPSDPLIVEGETISSGVGLDEASRLYTLIPGDCIAPSILYRLDTDTTAIDTGACPIAIAFTRFEDQ
ncbi:MAG TPA: hypothetical protein VLC48_05065 [Gemmatimonadota bacterium]|nr:hypothetical protein [Gemmatimonadota bacterium]